MKRYQVAGAIAVMLGLLLCQAAGAVTKTWTGGDTLPWWSANWNWDDGQAPGKNAGDDLVFPQGNIKWMQTVLDPSYATQIQVGTLLFDAEGYAIIPKAGPYIYLITPKAGITAQQASGVVEVQPPLYFTSQEQFVKCANAGAVLKLGGFIAFQNPLTFDGSGNIEISDKLGAGGQQVVKNGSGTLSLTGYGYYLTPIVVNAGTLLVNYSAILMDTNDIVLKGGTLAGSSSVNKISATGGTVNPGEAGVGMLTALSDVSLGGTSILSLTINGLKPSLEFNQLAVKGALSLGGELKVALGFEPPLGSKFLIIKNDGAGAVSGNFKDLPEAAIFKVNQTYLQVSYKGGDGNDVKLTAVAAPSEPVPPKQEEQQAGEVQPPQQGETGVALAPIEEPEGAAEAAAGGCSLIAPSPSPYR